MRDVSHPIRIISTLVWIFTRQMYQLRQIFLQKPWQAHTRAIVQQRLCGRVDDPFLILYVTVRYLCDMAPKAAVVVPNWANSIGRCASTLRPITAAQHSASALCNCVIPVCVSPEGTRGRYQSTPKIPSALAYRFCAWPSGGLAKQLRRVLETKINSISNAVISLMKSQCPLTRRRAPRGGGRSER